MVNLSSRTERVSHLIESVRDSVSTEMELDSFTTMAQRDRDMFRDLVAACDYLSYLANKADKGTFDGMAEFDEICVYLEKTICVSPNRTAVLTGKNLLDTIDLLIVAAVVPKKKRMFG